MNTFKNCNRYIKNILLRLKNEGNPAICDAMNEPREHYAEGNEPGNER